MPNFAPAPQHPSVTRGNPMSLSSVRAAALARAAACVLALIGTCLFAPPASAGYVVTDLGTLGGPYSQAFGVGPSGHVVGAASPANGVIHAFLYDGGTMS